MISLDLKPDNKAAVKLPLSSKELPTSAISFASYLYGKSDLKESGELPQNGTVVLSLQENIAKNSRSLKHLNITQDIKEEKSSTTKSSSTITSLLQGSEKEVNKGEINFLELNPQLTQDKTVAELKVIIKEAKQYLKDKITSLEGFKKSEIEALPKTLKGLTQVAKKFGIDVSKITLEEVRQSVADSKEVKTKVPAKTTDLNETVEQVGGKRVKSGQNTQLNQTKDLSKNIVDSESKESETKVSTKTIDQDDVVEQASSKKVKTSHHTQTRQTDIQSASAVKEEVEEQIKTDIKAQQIVETKNVKKTVQHTLLFKETAKAAEITTEQLVQAKLTNDVQKTQKQKTHTDNTLELLLRGEKVLKKDTALTADFSVATAKVIAPTAKTEVQQSLENLLSGEGASESNHTKTDSLQLNKADSFEVKINEAKQMTKYLSQDVKQAIDDYKAPFTRVKVQLNPQKLGEIDLTVVQRGKNLHINLSSNNAAINTLAMNANDLKVQLNNNGIQNASLNFSNMSQGDQSGSGSHAHQQQHNRQNAQEEYGYFQQEDTNEEILSSLEIVVPHYA